LPFTLPLCYQAEEKVQRFEHCLTNPKAAWDD